VDAAAAGGQRTQRRCDAEHVAYTSYAVKGLERGTGVTAALMWGSPSDRLEVESADAGLVTSQGKAVWSTKFDEPSALSPPSLGKTAVAVVTAKTVRLLDRDTGSKIGDVSMFTNYLGISANHVSRVNVTRPRHWQTSSLPCTRSGSRSSIRMARNWWRQGWTGSFSPPGLCFARSR